MRRKKVSANKRINEITMTESSTIGLFSKQISSKGAHFGVIFEGVGQKVRALEAKEGAPKIKRLGAEQGNRPSCFEYPGGQLVEVIALQKCGPARPLIMSLHRVSIA